MDFYKRFKKHALSIFNSDKSKMAVVTSSSSTASQFTPPVATHWSSTNFVLAAGTATFQPSTRKVLVVQDTAYRDPSILGQHIWFLPRGRKDIGETIEACALRETLEEAGYVASLLRAPLPTCQPADPSNRRAPHSEAIHIQAIPHPIRQRIPVRMTDMRMYLAFWYICVIPSSAKREADYGVHFVGAHEKGYDSQLVDVAEAVNLLSHGHLEYRYPTGEGEERVPGCVLEKETGRELEWDDISAESGGSVEAMVVAKGWEIVSTVEEWENIE